ncbi:hypothetical protein GF314_10200 [bacterium]|nr:hypothetical protein [bacterium]
MTIIYALSGIALNHLEDWNPSYQVTRAEHDWGGPVSMDDLSPDDVLAFLARIDARDRYKSHYWPAPDRLKIFLHSGNVVVDAATGAAVLENLRRRPVFYEVNFLHYDPKGLWTWFSDLYCVALMVVTITGLFVLKGRKGITGRGAWLTAIGVVLPLGFLMAYL